VRLHDVAVRAGVSTSTASRALNGIGELSEETRGLVRRAAAELNYRPSPTARSLRTRRSKTVGLVVPTIMHAFYGAVTHGAQAVLDASGYRLILIDAGEDGQSIAQAVQTLVEREVDGLLVSAAPLTGEEFIELFGSTPAVFLDEVAPGAGVANVVLENQRGIRLLVDHMVEHGHERIAYLGGPTDRTSGRERLAGFVAAMREHALSAELVCECEWTIASGLESAARLLAAEQPPSAIVTASGELGLGVLAAARRAHMAVGEELALACFDDLYFSPLLQPALTSVAYDAHLIGRAGSEQLLRAMEDRETEEQRIDVTLVVRRSCGCQYDAASELAAVQP
jgi:LacI family transcriptional regulator